jgi:hypothetical protein
MHGQPLTTDALHTRRPPSIQGNEEQRQINEKASVGGKARKTEMNRRTNMFGGWYLSDFLF